MNVLVTGGAGFIGSHLVEALLDRGDAVFVIDDLSTGSLAHLSACRRHPNLHMHVGALGETPVLAEWTHEADAIFHLAAAVGVRFVIENRVHTLQTNVATTEAVLACASEKGVPVFLASSSEVYGASVEPPFDEGQPLRLGSPDAGRWGYAASKAMGEFLALAYAKEHRLPVVIGRLFNTAGPRQTHAHGMVLPTFVRQALQRKPITVYGDGSQTRCFSSVSDVVKAVLALMERDEAMGQIFNIGSEAEISVDALARRVKHLTGSTSEIVYIPYHEVWDDFEDMHRRVPNLNKIKSTIDYHPDGSIDDIILSIIEYQREQSPE
jgi:UDP-glucose 4-epimerase